MVQTVISAPSMVSPARLRKAPVAQPAGDTFSASAGTDAGVASANQLRAAALQTPPPASDPRDAVINAAQPGQQFDFTDKLVPGKLNVVEFFSPDCPHCTEMAPRLQELVQKNPDVVVLRLDINRPDAKGIDWNSPLAQQYHLNSVPYFQIYQSDGSLAVNDADNHQASGTVEALLNQAGIK